MVVKYIRLRDRSARRACLIILGKVDGPTRDGLTSEDDVGAKQPHSAAVEAPGVEQAGSPV